MNFIGKLLPVDRFQLSLQASLPRNYQAILHHLYQPLIGIQAVHLYTFLVEEARLMEDLQIEAQTHHHLMSHLNLSLHVIYEARLKLEAIGLLRTYQLDGETGKTYRYELCPPYSSQKFFEDLMLAELLERHVGPRRFQLLQKAYVKRQKPPEEGSNITASFHEVFQTYEPTSPIRSAQPTEEVEAQIQLRQVDFTPIESSLKQRNIPITRVLSKANKKVISQLANLYDLESYELEKALLWALTDEYRLDYDQFKAACHDLFASKTEQAQIKLRPRQPANQTVEKQDKQPKTKMEQLIHHFERITPKQLLEDLSGGHHASDQDLKLISDIMVKQGLPMPVMNVLIHFTMLQSNMMLSRPYLEKVASHWSRAKLKTAREAIEFAMKQTKPSSKAKPKSYSRRPAVTDEVIPDWFKERQQSQKQVANTSQETTEDREAVKEMEAILRKYSSQ